MRTSIAGPLGPFYFRVPGNENAIVPNGGGAEGDIAFWWKTSSGELEDVVYLLLDDSGGFNPGEPSDNDHDDMIIRLTALPVPEPGTAALTLLGLGMLGAATRSRRRGSAANIASGCRERAGVASPRG